MQTTKTWATIPPARTIRHWVKEGDYRALVAYVNSRSEVVLAGVLGALEKHGKATGFVSHVLARPFERECWPQRIASAEWLLQDARSKQRR